MKNNRPSTPQKITGLRGKVIQDRYGSGSKSERNAIFLETDSNKYLLRRKTGPVFGDKALEDIIGSTVECDGFLMGDTLLADTLKKL